MMKKCDTWPVVLPNDNGIRPAGPPDVCFYCRARVGEPHGATCVCVEKLVQYGVYVHGKKVGTFQRYDPHHWTFEECEFHKNQSSWCSDNALDAIVWTDEAAVVEVDATPEGECTCSLLKFQFEEVVDAGPFVEIRECV